MSKQEQGFRRRLLELTESYITARQEADEETPDILLEIYQECLGMTIVLGAELCGKGEQLSDILEQNKDEKAIWEENTKWN